MFPVHPFQQPEIKLNPAHSGRLQALRVQLSAKDSAIKNTALEDARLVSLCQKLPSEAWMKIPEVFNRQLASVFWKSVDNRAPLCSDTAFAQWFIRDRAAQEASISQVLVNSLLSAWPEELSCFPKLMRLLEAFLPKGINWPSSHWQQEVIQNIIEGKTSINAALVSLGGDFGFADSIQKILWKQLLKQFGEISASQRELKYFGLKAIVDTGFANGQSRWPELNVDCLNQVIPTINILENYCAAFHRIAVNLFEVMTMEERSKLNASVLTVLDIWSANKFADQFLRFNKVDRKRKKLQIKKLQTAANVWHVKANRLLGELYVDKNSRSGDWDRGIEHLKNAADGQDQEAQSLLSKLYHQGEIKWFGADQVLKWEISAFKKGDSTLVNRVAEGAEAGNPEAQFSMATYCLNNGEHGQGIEWLKKACAQNHEEAMFKQAVMLMSGDRVALNREEALRLYKKLEGLSFVEAIHHLALFYRLGISTAKNLDLAISLYRKAAEHGGIQAAFMLGCFYSDGIVIPASSELARYFLCKASMAGHTGSQRQLDKLLGIGGNVVLDTEAT